MLAVPSCLAVLLVVISLGQRLDWRLDLLSHLRLNLAVALLLAAVVQLFVRPWRLAAFYGGVAATTGVGALLLAPASPGSVASDDPPLRVVHANVSGRSLQVDVFVRWIDETQPDLMLLQEATPHTLVAIESRLPDYELLAAEPRWDTRGVAAFAKVPAEAQVSAEAELLRLPPDEDRPFPEIRVMVGEQRLRLLHFSTTRPMPGNNYAWQGESFAGAAMWIDETRLAGAVPILVGDFNQTPQGVRVRDLCDAAGLRAGFVRSWPTSVPRWLALPINGFLVPEHVGLRNLRTGPFIGGDHLPIMADLVVGS
jgi:endonuclease/exonuclease/phosphatase (EEP) superfamily protein YafD